MSTKDLMIDDDDAAELTRAVRETAREYYRRVLDMSPDHPKALDARLASETIDVTLPYQIQ